MEILRTCLDEIGLSGLEGCTLGELWEDVLNREPPVPFKLDSPTKAFIWMHLLRCAREAKTVQIFLLAEPRELVQTVSTHSPSSKVFKSWAEYLHPFPYRPISDKGIRGSCAGFSNRREITEEILQEQLDLSTVVEKYGDRLVLVGSQELRERTLIPRDQDPYIDISGIQYCLLEVVGSSRHHGILRPFVTTKYLKIDARSTFHHCKVLRQAGLVTVKSGVISRGGRSQNTHLLILSRYPPPDVMETNTAEQLCSILQAAPHHTLPIQTIYERMGKRVKGVKSALLKKGFIEVVTMGEVSPDFAQPPEVARLKAYRLLKPYEADKLGGEEEMEEEEEEEEKDVDPSCQTPVVFELPLEMQGYRLIDSCGPEGITNSDFCSKGLALDLRTSRMISKALIRSSRVVTIVNDDTGIRKIKLISARHVTKNKLYESLQEEKAKSGVQDLELAIRTGDEYFQTYGRKLKTEPPGDGGEAPVVKQMDDEFLLPWQQVEGQDEEVTQALMGDGKRVEGDGLLGEGVPLADVELESQAASSTGTPVSRSPFPELEPHSGTSCSLIPESVSKRSSQALGMTYHQLKRTNIIVKYVESVRVLQGIVDLCKHMREVEIKEGRKETVDRKTVRKLMVRLEQDKRICHREVELKFGEQTQTIELYYVPDTSEDELTATVEKALRTFQGMIRRRELRGKPKEEKKKGRKKKKKEEEEEDEEEEESSETENEQLAISEETSLSLPNVANKFQRLRQFHYFLWILAYGFSSCPKDKRDEMAEREEGERMLSEPYDSSEQTSQQQQQRSGPSSLLSPANFPWVGAVHQLPTCGSRGPGWLSYNDVLYHMPVSLIALLIKLWPLQRLSPKFIRYFEVAEHQNQLLHELPKKLRRHIISRGRDVACVNRLMEQLEDMKLITLEGFDPRDRANVYVRLNKAASVLDTSTAQPRRSFFLEEARPLFATVHHQFFSLGDLERYWFQLQSVCLQTPIILGGKLQRKIQRERERAKLSKPDLLHVKDTHALPYIVLGRASHRDKFREFNKRGFGAGGLPPLFFSHANRNWTQIIGRTGKEPLPKLGEVQVVDGEVYGPGMGLAKLPQIEMHSGGGGGRIELQGREERRVVEAGEAMVKRLKLLGKPGLKAGIVRVLGSQVKQHEGGRGQKRARVRRAIEAAKRVKKARESIARYKAARTPTIIVDRPGEEEEEEEEEERDRGLPERVHWNQREDSFLLLAYLASAILNRKGQPAVTYSEIKEALNKEFHTSRHKSTAMVRRHVVLLRRRRFFSSIEISVAEALQELDSLEEEAAPKLTFEAILDFVKHKCKSEQEQVLSRANIILPSSLRELHENYEVVENKEHKQVSLPLVETEQEVNQAQVADLIIASLGAEESSYDQFKAFKLFESFPEVDVRAAFEYLRSQYLIKQKRSVLGIPRHKGPLETQSYDLSANFYSRLEQHYPPELLHEVDAITHHLQCQSISHSSDIQDTNQEAEAMETGGSSGSSEVNVAAVPNAAVSNAAVSLDSSRPIRVESEEARGGTVAALVGMLFDTSKRSPVYWLRSQTNGLIPRPLASFPDQWPRSQATSLFTRPLASDQQPCSMNKVSCEPVLPAAPLEPREGSEGGGVTHQLLQRALEDEEESEDEAGVETLVQHPSRLVGTGLSTLLQMDDAAILRHGCVDIELGLNCAKLLDPLPEEELQVTEAGWYRFKNDSDIVGDPLSLDAYLSTCETHLRFSEADVEFARMLYEVVDGGGERGVPMARLQSSLILSSYGHHVFGLEDHIQSLLNFQMVHLVGINHVLVASHAHCGRWLMSSEGGGDRRVPYRPWSAISSSDPNATLLTKYREGVLAHIMAHPGITLLHLAAHFSGVLHPNGLREILQSLELERCVQSQRPLQPTESCTDPESLETICYETVLH